MITQAHLLALIIQHGLPAALEIAKIFKTPDQEVTPEMWDKLEEINNRPFEYYQGPNPPST